MTSTPTNPGGPISGPLNFQFTLPSQMRTSAGVYDSNGVLKRLLWGNDVYSQGSHTASWDGTDDDFQMMPDGDYQIKLLKNNVNYEWLGVVGNTSKNTQTKVGKHRSFLPMGDIVISGGTAFYTTLYNERTVSQGAFLLSDPQVKIDTSWPNDGGISQATEFVCTDNINVYWGGDKENANSWIFATPVNDHTQQVSFSAGSFYENYASAIGQVGSRLSGMDVQKTGSYLFKTHVNLNRIDVLNKTTGAFVRSITYNTPGVLKVFNNNLWVISGQSVFKHTINGDGTISASTLTLTGFSIPFGLAITPDNAAISVMDGTPVHQIKTFSTTTGSLLWTMGQLGGYENTAVISYDRFDFYGGFMAYQPDGSFWVGDKGNYRTIHYSASRQYIENIAYLPATYRTCTNQVDPSKLYADYLEFTVDYSKPLLGTNGSWSLSRNFRQWMALGEQLSSVTTLSNGRSYGLLTQHHLPANYYYQVIELTNSGLRDCSNNNTFGISNQEMKDDGRFSEIYSFLNVEQEWREQLLTGFDGAGNPQWGAKTTVAKSPVITSLDPWNTGIGGTMRAGEETTSGYFCVLNSFTGDNDTDTKWHFGIVKRGDTKWIARTARSTFKNYSGYFPYDGGFDIGNSVGPYGGSVALASDRSFYWGYHGEFWKNNQCNVWNQIYENGLPVGQFGSQGGDAGMAGNSFNATMAKNSYGTFLFHNDESVHQGIHVWKITGLDTIVVDTITSFLPFVQLPDDGYRLMKGLPFNAPLISNAIWTRDQPEFYHQLGNTAELYQLQCYRTRYDIRKPGDISWWQSIDSSTGSYIGPYITKALLPVTASIANWRVYGEVSYKFNLPFAGNVYLEVIDNTGKILCRFYNEILFDDPATNKPYRIYVNGTAMGTLSAEASLSLLWNPNVVEFSRSGSNVLIKYGVFPDLTVPVLESGADISRPQYLRVFIFGQNYERRIVLADWTFKDNITYV